MKCDCGRTLGTNLAQVIVCKCGARVEVTAGPGNCRQCGEELKRGVCHPCAGRREEIEDKLEICEGNECGFHSIKGGQHNCAAIPKPCQLAGMISRDGFNCLLGFHDNIERVDGQQWYEPGCLDGTLTAVTSLSVLAHHMKRQTVCLNSWHSFGLSIVSMNSPEEIKKLRPRYPQVREWIPSYERSDFFKRPTQLISNLAGLANVFGTVLVCNSDLEIYGRHETLLDRMAADALVVGIRHNYRFTPRAAKREDWGLDAFVCTASMAETMPKLPFAIGRPGWDYWVPAHFRHRGYRMEFIGEPLFFHESHDQFWDRAEWDKSMVALSESDSGIVIKSQADSIAFRMTLPFPPSDRDNA